MLPWLPSGKLQEFMAKVLFLDKKNKAFILDLCPGYDPFQTFFDLRSPSFSRHR